MGKHQPCEILFSSAISRQSALSRSSWTNQLATLRFVSTGLHCCVLSCVLCLVCVYVWMSTRRKRAQHTQKKEEEEEEEEKEGTTQYTIKIGSAAASRGQAGNTHTLVSSLLLLLWVCVFVCVRTDWPTKSKTLSVQYKFHGRFYFFIFIISVRCWSHPWILLMEARPGEARLISIALYEPPLTLVSSKRKLAAQSAYDAYIVHCCPAAAAVR